MCSILPVHRRMKSPASYLSVVGLMGAAYTLGKKRHLAIDLIAMKLEDNPAKQAVVHLLINLVSLFFCSSHYDLRRWLADAENSGNRTGFSGFGPGNGACLCRYSLYVGCLY